MKKLLMTILVMILVSTRSAESPITPIDYQYDQFDIWMQEEYPGYNEWPQKTKDAFRRQFENTRDLHYWFPKHF